MCRFNSGVGWSYTELWIYLLIHPLVLFQSSSSTTVQVLLASRVRSTVSLPRFGVPVLAFLNCIIDFHPIPSHDFKFSLTAFGSVIHTPANVVFLTGRPDIQYFCDVTYDPFDYLRDNKKTYGQCVQLILSRANHSS